MDTADGSALPRATPSPVASAFALYITSTLPA
jgi:hypothetical protein